jgi:hypothetical protein
MAILRIGSRGSQLALWQANHGSGLLSARYGWARGAKTISERNYSRFERIRTICRQVGSTLVILKWGFGEYYQCGYWAALENRGSRLFAAARGANPLFSAAVRDLRDLRFHLIGEWRLTGLAPDANLKVVLKRGSVPYPGGLTSRLSLLFGVPPQVLRYA